MVPPKVSEFPVIDATAAFECKPDFSALRAEPALVFSTADVPYSDRLERWRFFVDSNFVPLRPEPSLSHGEFFGEISSRTVGGLTLTTVAKGGQRMRRDRTGIALADPDLLFFTIQLCGEIGIAHGDARTIARGGDLYMLDARTTFELNCAGSKGLALGIPRRVCDGRLPPFESLHGLVVSPKTAIAGLLRDYLISIASTREPIGLREGEDIADHILTLAGHAIASRPGEGTAPRQAIQNALFARLFRIIDQKLCDQDLGPLQLARAVGVSLRQLQVVCARRGTSPMRAILDRRITLAKKRLLDPKNVDKTITEIAFECGFRDLTHFGRVFAAATSVTPRAWRRDVGQS
jgi:AraC family transcriptional activator of tynA and feaB